MPLKTRPLGSNCLIEVIKDYSEVSRMDENEDMSYGKLISFHVTDHHLTASSAIKFSVEDMKIRISELNNLVGKTVRWEQYAEGGQTFEEDGKTYALIPYWRLISVTEE